MEKIDIKFFQRSEPPSLELALQQCTFPVTTSTGQKGTGFFVAPGHVLTAAHLLASSDGQDAKLRIYWQDNTYDAKPLYIGNQETTDLALLEVEICEHPVVSIRPVLRLSDEVYAFGFSKQNLPNGTSLTLRYQGPTYRDGAEYLSFKLGVVDPGMSGSPLVNLRTGFVVGMIVETQGRGTLIGGTAIGARTILQTLPDITQQPLEARRWSSLAKESTGRSELDRLDKAFKPEHFALFPQDKISIEEIYIEPNFELIDYNEFTPERRNGEDFRAEVLEILRKQKVLMIFGPYGCGKTVVSKRLQMALEVAGYDTIFIACNEIGDHIDKLEELVDQRLRLSGTSLFLFFDGFDETSLLRRDKADLRDKTLRTLLTLSAQENVFAIINSRQIFTIGEQPILKETYSLCMSHSLTARCVANFYTTGEAERFHLTESAKNIANFCSKWRLRSPLIASFISTLSNRWIGLLTTTRKSTESQMTGLATPSGILPASCWSKRNSMRLTERGWRAMS